MLCYIVEKHSFICKNVVSLSELLLYRGSVYKYLNSDTRTQDVQIFVPRGSRTSYTQRRSDIYALPGYTTILFSVFCIHTVPVNFCTVTSSVVRPSTLAYKQSPGFVFAPSTSCIFYLLLWPIWSIDLPSNIVLLNNSLILSYISIKHYLIALLGYFGRCLYTASLITPLV